MSALDRVFRSRRPSQERPLAAIIAGLWRNGEQGVRFEASDLSTMFQDAAGTLPVYAPGSGQIDPPVGLWLDKRVGAVRGPNVVINGTFDSDTLDWSKGEGWSISGGALRKAAGSGTVYVNATQACLVVGRWYEVTLSVLSISADSAGVSGASFSAVPGSSRLRSSPGTIRFIGQATSNLLYVSARQDAAAEIDVVSAREIAGNHAYQTTTTSRPTLSARYNQLTGTESLATQSVTVVATTYVLKTAGPGSVTLSGAASGTYMAGRRIITCTAGVLTLTVSDSVTQADLRQANAGVGLPEYQRVLDANTYNTVGFPLYLRFDGVDDWMQTASIDFSGSDKILFAAAVRKESDASVGVICELSVEKNANTGVVALLAPGTNGLATFVWASKGTVEALVTATGMPSPISAVLVGLGDISGKISRLRVNGSIIANNAGNQGTGNYGNYALYIGRRSGASLPVKGRIYGLLSRGGELVESLSPKVEKYLNSKARVF